MRHLLTILIILGSFMPASAQLTDILISPKVEPLPDPPAGFVSSVRGVQWYYTPAQVAAAEKGLQHSEDDTDGIFSVIIRDQFLRAQTDLDVVYYFARTSNKKAPKLVMVSLSFSPVSYYTFLAVGVQLQNRYSINNLDLDDSSVETVGVLYNENKTDTAYFIHQDWKIGDTRINHTIFLESPLGASHTLEYQVSQYDELMAVAKELYDRNELEKKERS
ncbi:MAG: hypothetical protein F4Z82_08705 [Caldilineaceae bacterium SB0668_bin_21]|nr:hypothetical protein [Caldilineaceae bacterium SB0668_bin_21]MYB60254.1 hypothetical protein [Gemmatimonadota bacterium]